MAKSDGGQAHKQLRGTRENMPRAAALQRQAAMPYCDSSEHCTCPPLLNFQNFCEFH